MVNAFLLENLWPEKELPKRMFLIIINGITAIRRMSIRMKATFQIYKEYLHQKNYS
jgi:hypothetical protein